MEEVGHRGGRGGGGAGFELAIHESCGSLVYCLAIEPKLTHVASALLWGSTDRRGWKKKHRQISVKLADLPSFSGIVTVKGPLSESCMEEPGSAGIIENVKLSVGSAISSSTIEMLTSTSIFPSTLKFLIDIRKSDGYAM